MSWNKFIVLEFFIPISKPQRSKSWNKNWKMFGLRTANFPNYFRIAWKPFDDLDGAPIASKSHTHPSHSQTSRLLTSSLSLGVSVPRPTQCVRGV